MEVVIVIISWILFGGAASYFATQRGRDPFAWFFIGMLLGVLGLLLLFLLPALNSTEKESLVATDVAVENPKEESWTGVRLKEWFYLNSQHNQVGPIPYSALSGLWESKAISDQTYVWSEGMEEWKKIGESPELKEALE